MLWISSRFTFFISECDIEYISPSNYKPPELRDKGTNGTNGEGFDADDHYERLIRGSLKQLEKQKVIFTRILRFQQVLIYINNVMVFANEYL